VKVYGGYFNIMSDIVCSLSHQNTVYCSNWCTLS